MADIEIKRGDTGPAVLATLSDKVGVVDLTNATQVRFHMLAPGAATPVVSRNATITDALTGKVRFDWQTADTATAGEFYGEFQVTFSDGTIETFPNDRQLDILIEGDLDGGTVPVALVSLADVHAHLNIPDNDDSHDSELLGFIKASRAPIENYCGPVLPTTFTETYAGGTTSIVLRNAPVISITSVTEYTGTVSQVLTAETTGTTPAYGYYLDSNAGILWRRGGGYDQLFASGRDSVVVVYVAGYSAVPDNIRLGTLELIRTWYQRTQQGARPQYNPAAQASTQQSAVAEGSEFDDIANSLLLPNRRAPSIG